MPESNFVDYIKIFCRSGDGGAGSAHLHREKFLPKGGPDGGDGGRGGNIYAKGNRNLWTLLHLRYKKHIIAGNGQPGSSATKTGSSGEDITIEVVSRSAERNNREALITLRGRSKVKMEPKGFPRRFRRQLGRPRGRVRLFPSFLTELAHQQSFLPPADP